VLRCHAVKISRLLKADLALIAITIIWGSTFTIVKVTLVQVSPILFLCLRFWLATLAAIAFMPRALFDLKRKTIEQGLLLAGALLGGFIFQTVGLRWTTPSRSAFITSLAVLLVPVLGFLVFRHRPRFRTLIGVAVATVGLGLLTLETVSLKLGWGDFLTLLCAVVFALHILLLGSYLPQSDYRQLVVLQLSGAAILCTIIGPFIETPFMVWNARLALSLFVTGILATGAAFYIQVRAQRHTTPNRTALIFSLEPFVATLCSYIFLGETLTTKGMAGGILVLAGILISEFRRNAGRKGDGGKALFPDSAGDSRSSESQQ
jgi:drug/metabolite transporter (DMT)-like permease